MISKTGSLEAVPRSSVGSELLAGSQGRADVHGALERLDGERCCGRLRDDRADAQVGGVDDLAELLAASDVRAEGPVAHR